MTNIHSIYKKLEQTKAKLGFHYSDLYAEVTEETRAIIQEYEYKMNVTIFKSQVDEKFYYDIPFANDHYFDEKIKRATGGRIEKL